MAIISPFFPPSGLPPVHRARQFARWLPEFGWKPIVMTVDSKFYQDKPDLELANLISPDIEVIRTKAVRPKKPGGWGIGDLGIRSILHLWLALRKLCRSRKIDLLYLISPPNHQLLVGRFIYAEFGVPYIIDFTDPWVSDWLSKNARPFTKLWFSHLSAVLLEPVAIKRASHITSVSEGTNTGILNRYRKMSKSSFTALPFGGEQEVFDYLKGKPSSDLLGSNNGIFKLVYTGAMWEAAYPVLDCFLDALKLMKDCNPDLYKKIKVYFIGTTYSPDASGHYQVLPRAEAKSVAEVVSETPARLPFLDALRSLQQADGLLILGSIEPHYTASRLLPYIHSGRPIFALFHKQSDGSKLLSDSHAGVLLEYDGPESLSLMIRNVYNSLVKFIADDRDDSQGVDWNIVSQYSARTLTERLASIFDRVVCSA